MPHLTHGVRRRKPHGMEKGKPQVGTKAEADRTERQAREAAALRENLRRRKEQARARELKEPKQCP